MASATMYRPAAHSFRASVTPPGWSHCVTPSNVKNAAGRIRARARHIPDRRQALTRKPFTTAPTGLSTCAQLVSRRAPSHAVKASAAETDEDDFDDAGDADEDVDESSEEPDAIEDFSDHVSDSAKSTHASEQEAKGEAASNAQDVEDAAALADVYSVTMQAAMGNAALVYRHELGMNYARVLPDLIVGSCLQNLEDVDVLRDNEGVGSVLCLQQDSDLEYFGLNLNEIVSRTQERGDIQHIRAEIRDFDPFSLRLELPMAVAKMHRANQERGTVYVHCTAGLGRAPAVALAYMWWMRDFRLLEDANQVLQAVRPCGPKLFAIRAALCDLLTGNPTEPKTVAWRSRGTMPRTVEVAGLDVGWHNRMPLERTPGSSWWTVARELPVGTYYYKFIVDGDKWSFSPDAPLTQPDRDGNVNNFSEVPGLTLGTEALALRKRIMEDGTPLEEEERALVVKRINELAATL